MVLDILMPMGLAQLVQFHFNDTHTSGPPFSIDTGVVASFWGHAYPVHAVRKLIFLSVILTSTCIGTNANGR